MGTLSQVHKRTHGGEVSNVDPTTGIRGSGAEWHAKTIQAGLSTQIIVQAQDASGAFNTVGAIQTLTPTETRPLVRISEVGTDGVLQVVPNAAFTIELAVTRLVFDYRRLPAAFSRGFRHIHAQRIPFDIKVIDYNRYAEYEVTNEGLINQVGDVGDSTGQTDLDRIAAGTVNPIQLTPTTGEVAVPDAASITTRYINCWLTSYSYTYDQSNYLITENATVWAETVIDQNSPLPLLAGRSDGLETFFNQSLESNAMATAFIGGRAAAVPTEGSTEPAPGEGA